MIGKIKRVHHLNQLVFVFLLVLIVQFSVEFLPTPVEILKEAFTYLGDPDLRKNLMATAGRVYLSSFLALLLGITIGVADYFNSTISDMFNSIFYPTQFLSEAVLAILAIAVLGINPLVVYVITVISIVPDVFIATQEGLQELDKKILELGKVYAESRLKVFRHLVIPQVLPYIFIGGIRAHATAWDIVGTVEVFLALGGMGYLVQNQFRLLNLPELFALAIILISAGLISDRILRIIKRQIDRRYMHGDNEHQEFTRT